MNNKRRVAKLLLIVLVIANIITNNVCCSIAANMKDTNNKNVETKESYGKSIIIKYKDNNKKAKDNVKNKLKKRKIKSTKELKNTNYNLLEFDETENLAEIINELGQDSNIDSIQPNYEIELFSVQDDVYKEIVIGSGINIEKAWETTKGSEDVLVAVLDGNIDINHPEFTGRIYQNPKEIPDDGIDNDSNGYIDDVNSWDFTGNDNTVYDSSDETHGTAVCGIIAAAEDGTGVSGVAPKIRLLPLKVANGKKGYVWDAIKAIEYAGECGAAIVSCSWGTDKYSPVLEKAIRDSGMCFICAAGNDGEERVVYPAGYDLPNVISVGAVNKDLTLAGFSNYGDTVDIAAPGVEIYSTYPDNSYGYISGTSAAVPFVTGVAALIKSCKGELTASEISDIILNNAVVNGGLSIVDAGKAIDGINNGTSKDALVSEIFGDIPANIKKIIEESTTYRELEESDKRDLSDYFGIVHACMNDLDNRGYSLIDAIRISAMVSKYNISIEEVVKLVPLYEGLGELENELSKLQTLLQKDVTDEYKSQIMNLFREGIGTTEIWSCYIFCKTFDLNISDVLNIDESINDSDLSSSGYSEEEKTLIMDIASNYNVKLSLLIECIKNSGLTVEEINDKLIEEGGLFELSEDDSEAAFKANRGQYSYKTNNCESVNLNTGSLTIESTDLSLPGKNGLDLNIVTKYDSSEANLYKTGNNSISIETRNERDNLLGSGWSFGFPTMECYTDRKYLHRPDGSSYLAIPKDSFYGYETYKIYNDNGLNGAKLYELNHDELEDKGISEFSYNGTDSRYVLVHKDGKREYFCPFGKLIGIVDRFGNSIKFQYEYVALADNGVDSKGYRLKKIVDSVARVVNFIYENTTDGKKVTIKLEDGSTIQYKLEKITSSLRTSSLDVDLTTYIGDYNLVEKVDLLGRSIIYTYDIYDTNFNYTQKNFTSTRYDTNFYSMLEKVKYPTGAFTEYSYIEITGNCTSKGLLTYLVLDTRKDVDNGVEYNKQTYSFGGYTGYPSISDPDLPNTYEYYTIVTDGLNNTVEYTFDYKHRRIKEEYKDNNSNPVKLIEYCNYYDGYDPEKVVTYKYDKNNSDEYIRTVQNYICEYGDIKGYWDTQNERYSDDSPYNNEHKITCTYNESKDRISENLVYDPVYRLMTSKEYKKDANTAIREDYTLRSDYKAVESMTISEKIGNGSFVVKAKKSFRYDSYGNVIQELDYLEDNNWSSYITTNYSYDDNVSSRNGKFNGAYLTRKEVLGVKDADGNLVEDKNGNKTGIICEEYKYNDFGQMTDYIDANGNITKYTYDKSGRVLTTILPDNQNKSRAWVYDDTANTVTATDENGNKIRYDYDGLGNLIYEQVYDTTTGTYKNVRQYSYDPYCKLDWEKDLSGKAYTDYSYYDDGRLNTKIVKDYTNNNALAYQETYTYDDATSDGYSVVTKVIKGETNSPDIVTKLYTNKNGMMEKVQRINSGSTYTDTYKYDYVGNKTEELSARASAEAWSENYTAKFEYDYAGRVVKQYNVKGDYVTTLYDALGRVKSVTDMRGNKAATKYSSIFEYDNLGRLVKEKIPFSINSAGTIYYTVKKHYYDRNGNVVCEQISNNKPGSTENFSKTEYRYNSRNLLEMVITYDKGVAENYTQYYYDNAGNQKRMYTGLSSPLVISGLDVVTAGNDVNYSITKYDYNSYNLLSKMTDPLGKSESYIYDLAGRLKDKTDRNGNTTTFTYDAMDRITKREVTDASKKVLGSYTYKYYITGNRAQMSGGGATVNYVYDRLGRLEKETDSLSGTEKLYNHDANNNRINFALRKGTTTYMNIYYIYDKLDRLITVKESNIVNQGFTEVANYDYDENGNRLALAYPSNWNSTSYTYNLANKLETLTNKKGTTVISKDTYTYYLDGNQESKTDSSQSYPFMYVYDDLGRLIMEKTGDISLTEYTYDDYNNRNTMNTTTEIQ